jgi:hypothetical protein
MDKRLYQSGHIVIPLSTNIGHTLSPQPNFLIVEDIRGKNKVELPVLGDTICKIAQYKIVYREILPASVELNRMEEVREILYEQAYQAVPTSIVEPLTDYTFLINKLADVNFMLGLFQFRGVLQGFQLIIDTVKLQDIIDTENPPVVQ